MPKVKHRPCPSMTVKGSGTTDTLIFVEKVGMEKHTKSSNKKASKPPWPPRALSLDATDQKLMKEIAEYAMLKRARMEQMKALKKEKNANAMSALASSGNAIAMDRADVLEIVYRRMLTEHETFCQ